MSLCYSWHLTLTDSEGVAWKYTIVGFGETEDLARKYALHHFEKDLPGEATSVVQTLRNYIATTPGRLEDD